MACTEQSGSFSVFSLEQVAERAVVIVIPSRARNLLLAKTKEKADSSGKPRPRNDKFESFSAACEVRGIRCLREVQHRPND
jgi:hypothetical protein